MKKWLVLLVGLTFAGTVAAGSLNGDGVHGKSGCSSKDKVAQFNKFHSKQWSLAEQPRQSGVDEVEKAVNDEAIKTQTPLGEFI